MQLLDLVVELILDLFGFLLLEDQLVLVVDLGLSETLIALLPHIIEPLLESLLLGLVELFELRQLLLRVHIDFVDGFLLLTLFLFKLLFKIVDLILETFLGFLDASLVLTVLFLAQGQVLVTLLFCSGQGLTQGLHFFLEVLN